MSSYLLSTEAKKDFLSIRAYTLKRWGALQAQKYLDSLEKKCDDLVKRPHLGRERPEIKTGFRSISEGKHMIFYRVSKKGIEILRVLHTRVDIEYKLQD
ncbi:MAG: type II toxin-antitoxin system RelE/ParE family toxin [Gammaproteobacteria bacterium]